MEYIKNNYSKSKNNDCLVIGNPTCDLEYAKKELINISNILETEHILEKKQINPILLKN